MNKPIVISAAVLSVLAVAVFAALQLNAQPTPASAGASGASAAQSSANAAKATPTPSPERQRVRVMPAEAVSGDRTLRLPARTAPIEEAAVFPRATGIIAERRVDIGDEVRAGQVLAVVNAPELENDLAQARAEVRSAQAQEKLTLANRQRAESLVKNGMISQQGLNTQTTEHDRAVATREAAEQHVKRLQQMVGFKTVRAPFAGVVTARNIERGDRVVADQGNGGLPLYRIARMDKLRVQVDVPQNAAAFVKPGTAAELRFAELPGRSLPAKVTRSSGVIDSQVGAMRVEMVVENTAPRLPAGMSGEISMRLPAPATATSVPTNAIVTRQGQPLVATLNGENVLRFAQVQLGRNLGPRVEVLDGLTAGTSVVLSPNTMLRDGDRVDVIQPEKK
jgi:membrane fusion protein, multidrug efflux system